MQSNETENLQTEIADLWTEIRQKQARIYAIAPKLSDEEVEANRLAEKAKRKEVYRTTNGLTIHKLRLAGNSVKVVHIRYADIPGIAIAVPVPSFLRGVYDFLPRGGATHIVIYNGEKDQFHAVSSICHEIDGFDYKLGVTRALNQIPQEDANSLLQGLPQD